MIANESGIGIKTVCGSAKYDTLARIAAKLEIKKAEHSEELRVLYVALTRPKEKLIILSSAADWSKELSKIAANIRKDKLIDPYTVMSFTSYSDCILSSLIRHPDAHALRNAAGISAGVSLPCGTLLSTKIVKASSEEMPVTASAAAPEPDEDTVNEIEKRLSYEYPYSHLDGIVAKRIASKLDSEEIGGEYFASGKPAFISKNKLTPAQRGIATHRFMQYADYEKAGINVAAELQRLVEEGMLTASEAEVVDKKAVAEFFRSDLAKRLLSSEKVYKEYAFTVSIPLEEMEQGIKADGEVIIIEGVADCAFIENGGLVIIDFKTDRVDNSEELTEKYREQLRIYSRCLGEVIGLPVKQTLIYSFKLGETVEIK